MSVGEVGKLRMVWGLSALSELTLFPSFLGPLARNRQLTRSDETSNLNCSGKAETMLVYRWNNEVTRHWQSGDEVILNDVITINKLC
jgi:hypothetical protein